MQNFLNQCDNECLFMNVHEYISSAQTLATSVLRCWSFQLHFMNFSLASVGRRQSCIGNKFLSAHITAPWPFSLLSKHTYWVLTIHLAGHISRQTSCWYRIAMENQHIVLDPLMVRIMSGKLWFKSATQLPSSSKVRLSSLRGIGWIWFLLEDTQPLVDAHATGIKALESDGIFGDSVSLTVWINPFGLFCNFGVQNKCEAFTVRDCFGYSQAKFIGISLHHGCGREGAVQATSFHADTDTKWTASSFAQLAVCANKLNKGSCCGWICKGSGSPFSNPSYAYQSSCKAPRSQTKAE